MCSSCGPRAATLIGTETAPIQAQPEKQVDEFGAVAAQDRHPVAACDTRCREAAAAARGKIAGSRIAQARASQTNSARSP